MKELVEDIIKVSLANETRNLIEEENGDICVKLKDNSKAVIRVLAVD